MRIARYNSLSRPINEITGSIASAVEEQGAATREIAHNISQTSAAAQEVSGNITEVTTAANHPLSSPAPGAPALPAS